MSCYGRHSLIRFANELRSNGPIIFCIWPIIFENAYLHLTHWAIEHIAKNTKWISTIQSYACLFLEIYLQNQN